jgi:hypothetical protein
MPAMAWRRLVFPLPFGPIRQVSSPPESEKELGGRRDGSDKPLASTSMLIG